MRSMLQTRVRKVGCMLKLEVKIKKNKAVFKTKDEFIFLSFKSNHVLYIQFNGKTVVGQEFQEPLVKVENAALTTLFPMETSAFISQELKA